MIRSKITRPRDSSIPARSDTDCKEEKKIPWRADCLLPTAADNDTPSEPKNSARGIVSFTQKEQINLTSSLLCICVERAGASDTYF